MRGHHPSVINPEANFKTFKDSVVCIMVSFFILPFLFCILSILNHAVHMQTNMWGVKERSPYSSESRQDSIHWILFLLKSVNYKWRLLFCFSAALTQMLTQKLYSL